MQNEGRKTMSKGEKKKRKKEKEKKKQRKAWRIKDERKKEEG